MQPIRCFQDIVDGEVKTPDIATGAVTNAKIAPNAVTYSKIASGSIDSSKIVDQSIKSNDIAADAVGASEIRGVSKLLFGSCSITFTDNAVGVGGFNCPVTGASPGNHVVATLQSTWSCGGTPVLMGAYIGNNDIVTLNISFNTTCPTPNTADASVIVYQ
jgi:hypothetical protein